MTEPTQLEYEKRPSALRRNRKRIVLLTLLVAIAFSLFWWRTTIQLYARQMYLLRVQRRALSYTIDPSQIVYDDSVGALQMSKSPGKEYYTRTNGQSVMMWDPKVCDPLMKNWPPLIVPPGPRAMLFLHERFTETDTRLLLVVYAVVEPPNQYHPTESLMFHMQEVSPASDWRHAINPANGLGTPVLGLDFAERTKGLQMFGGQVDSNDPTHFTIRYRLGNEEGIIDGYEGDRREDAQGVPTAGLKLEVRQKKAGSPSDPAG